MMHLPHGQSSIGQKATLSLIKWLSWTGESAMFVRRACSIAVRLPLTLTILMPVGFGVNW
jgi:hypothetical protein